MQPSWLRSRRHKRTSRPDSADPSTTGAAEVCCAGTSSCASWWHGSICRRHRAPTARTRCRTPRIHSPILNSRSPTRPTPRARTATWRWPSTRRSRRRGIGSTSSTVGNAAQWQALADSAVARGEIPWISQESPPRPPMLPNFGLLQAWLMTSAEVTTERPPAPPSTSSAQMRRELSEVRQTVDHLTRDQLAIAYKWNDGAGTYTPPGHWNDIAAEYVRDARMSEVRAARAFALLNMAMHDAAVGCWGVKYT